jgi:hypothetical protein
MARTQGKGWFRTRKQSKGEFVLFCYYSQDPASGERKERFHKLGLVSQFPDDASRWTDVGRLGLAKIIDKSISAITFGELVSRYISSGAIGQKTLAKKKANGTVYVIRHNLEEYCLPRWGKTVVCEIKPKALEEWLVYLHEEKGLGWTTVSGKVKQAMQGAFKFGRKEELRCGSIASQTYLYPAAVKAGVFHSVEERNRDGKLVTRYFDLAGNPIKRWGWHNLRHSLASWLVSEGVDVKTVSSMLRHGSTRPTLDVYSHAVGPNQLAAQGQVPGRVAQQRAGPIAERKAEWKTARERIGSPYLFEGNGRHEETRTPDLYRVKVAL